MAKQQNATTAKTGQTGFTLPLEKEFKDYLEIFLNSKNAGDYISYTKGIFRGYNNIQPSLNLLDPINLGSIIYHKDRDLILQIIFSTVYTNQTDLKITSQYFSGFLCYMDFISEFQTAAEIRKLLKNYFKRKNTSNSAITYFVNLIQKKSHACDISLSSQLLRKKFLFRLFTQNRIAPGDDKYYFPITLIKKCEKGNLLGIKGTNKPNPVYKSVTTFFNKEVSKIRFLGCLNGAITIIPLNRISTLQSGGSNSTFSFTTKKGQTYDLYTEIDPNKPIPKGVISYKDNNVSKYAEPIKRKVLKDIVIDHDPEIALVMQAAANNNWLPRLGILKNKIDGAIQQIDGPDATISSNKKVNKSQLIKVYDLWQQNKNFPQLDKLLMDIIYLHSQMTLTMMDKTINGNKNKGLNNKSHPQLDRPIQIIPDYF